MQPMSASPPWLLFAGLALASLACVLRIRRRHLRTAASLALSAVATVLVRSLLAPRAFFHQNGQGPSWITVADRGMSDVGYGSGFSELFGPIARSSEIPDLAVFDAQTAASGLVTPCAYVIARGAAAPAPVAAALAAVLAIDPLAARLARSESYFATITTLLFLAAAALSLGGGQRGAREPRFWIGAAAAGFLAAQAARVHPIGWIPLACLPAVALFAPADRRTRIVAALAAAAVVGAITLAFDGPQMLELLHGKIGSQWMPQVQHNALSGRRLRPLITVLVLSLGVTLHRRTRLWDALALTAVLGVVALTINPLWHDRFDITESWFRLFGPAMLAAVAAALGSATQAGWKLAHASAAIALVTTAVFAARARTWLTLTTDAAELHWFLDLRPRLEPGATVVWMARAGDRVLELPLEGRGPLARIRWDARDPAPTLSQERPTYWYRSSLCSTPEGRPACEHFERAHTRRTIESRTLPAIPSLPWQPYPGMNVIEVTLERIEETLDRIEETP